MMSDVPLLSEFVGLLFCSLSIRRFRAEHLVDQLEQGMGDGDDGTLLACARKKSLVAGPE